MKRLNVLLIAIVTAVATMSATTVTVNTPGTISTLVSNPSSVTNLTVRGTINAADIYFISSKLTNLTELDITGINSLEACDNGIAYFAAQTSFDNGVLPQAAFLGNSKLTTVKLSDRISVIDEGAFAGCTALTTVRMPAYADSLGAYAFSGCTALSTITLPGSMYKIGSHAFSGCTSLESATFGTTNTHATIAAHAFDGCTALTTVTPPANCRTIDEGAFLGCSSLAQFAFPATVRSIGDDAFKGTALTAANLSGCNSLKTIGEWAFADNAALASVKIPTQVTSIGAGAFFMDSAIEEYNFSGSQREVSDFAYTGVKSFGTDAVELHEGITRIGKYAFAYWTDVVSYDLYADDIELIDDHAFDGNTGLQELRVRAKTQVPPLGEDVWNDVDQSQVLLKVNNDLINDYKEADQWKEFKIEPASSAESLADLTNVKAYFSGKNLVIEASREITEVMLYDPTGLELTRLRPAASKAVINTEGMSNPLYIVSGRTDDGKRFTLKLMRR